MDAITDALEDLPSDAQTRVGIVTFDDSVHYYDIAVRTERNAVLRSLKRECVFVWGVAGRHSAHAGDD